MIIFKRGENWSPSLLAILITGFFIFGFMPAASAEWDYAGSGMNEAYANVVLVDPCDAGIIYAATDYFLYISKDNGDNWRDIFTTPGKENSINFLAVSTNEQPTVYAATKEGLYASSNAGNDWQLIYRSAGQTGSSVNCIALDAKRPDTVYIAGDNGVFVSRDEGKSWSNISASLGTDSVKYIVAGPQGETLYAVSGQRIFKSGDSGATWQNVYTLLRQDEAEPAYYEEPAEDSEESFTGINFLAINPDKPAEVYAATSKGVLVSLNKGKDWSFITRLGLGSADIRHLLIRQEPPFKIYAATRKGVFQLGEDQKQWVQLYKGASFRDAKFLSIDQTNKILWAATGDGIFKTRYNGSPDLYGQMQIPEEISGKFKNEPTIVEVQRAAIKYAEVHPNKIRNWRRQAQMKALLPEFNLDYDKTVTYDTGTDRYYVGPKDWGFGFKWDISELIFSDDQTNIDVRSRLMVQLRDDILDDVTRLYYERRRLQVEMMMSPPKSERARYDKLLRLEELTAGIDALTGGYFFDNIPRP